MRRRLELGTLLDEWRWNRAAPTEPVLQGLWQFAAADDDPRIAAAATAALRDLPQFHLSASDEPPAKRQRKKEVAGPKPGLKFYAPPFIVEMQHSLLPQMLPAWR